MGGRARPRGAVAMRGQRPGGWIQKIKRRHVVPHLSQTGRGCPRCFSAPGVCTKRGIHSKRKQRGTTMSNQRAGALGGLAVVSNQGAEKGKRPGRTQPEQREKCTQNQSTARKAARRRKARASSKGSAASHSTWKDSWVTWAPPALPHRRGNASSAPTGQRGGRLSPSLSSLLSSKQQAAVAVRYRNTPSKSKASQSTDLIHSTAHSTGVNSVRPDVVCVAAGLFWLDSEPLIRCGQQQYQR